MSKDIQYLSATFYILCFQIILSNSRTSYLWRLNGDKTKIIEVKTYQEHSINKHEDDDLFKILASTEFFGDRWIRKSPVSYDFCDECQTEYDFKNSTNLKQGLKLEQKSVGSKPSSVNDELSCGKPVNFTYYDNLVGILNRKKHSCVPEPQVIHYFVTSNSKKFKNRQDLDIDLLKQTLKKVKKEKPKAVSTYIQLGNYWRIQGDCCHAIECFRRALSLSPHHAEGLLNLARILFALQYLDDAIYLTRRSLDVHPSDRGAWQQYFTLGEIFKAYGHYHDAVIHFKHSLELNPGYEPAMSALKEMKEMPASSTVHAYTIVIIACLVLGVLLVIVSSLDTDDNGARPSRHFNKALAMRSLRFGMTPRRKRGTS